MFVIRGTHKEMSKLGEKSGFGKNATMYFTGGGWTRDYDMAQKFETKKEAEECFANLKRKDVWDYFMNDRFSFSGGFDPEIDFNDHPGYHP